MSKIKRVAVVGGGMAGLMAALRLSQFGVQVTVYEAHEQVGGRVRSNVTFSKGRITEEGAELIGSFHTKWLGLALKYGLAVVSRMDPELYQREGLDVKLTLDKPLSMDEFLKLTKEMNTRVLLPIALLAKLIKDPSRPWDQKWLKKDWLMSKLDNMSVAEALEKIFKVKRDGQLWKFIEFKLVNDEVAPLDEMNFLGLLCKVRGGQGERFGKGLAPLLMGYWDELEIFRCADGCQELARKMEEEINSQQGCKVHRSRMVKVINISNDKVADQVAVTWVPVRNKKPGTGPGEREVFEFVILAIPPSVWGGVDIKINNQKVDPEAEIGKVGMDPAVKFFTDVKDRFWIKQKAAPYGGSLAIGQVWEGTDNQTRINRDPQGRPLNNDEKQGIVLSVFAGPILPGRKAPNEKNFTDGLKQLYPDYDDVHTKPPLFSNWPIEPFIETGYVSPKKKQILTIGQEFSKPFHERLFFAGEHTQMDFFGYMEGALRSGERAAHTLMLKKCGLLKEPAPKSPSRTPQKPAPKSPAPTRVARVTPTRETTVSEREIGFRPKERLPTDHTGEVESPFLNEELFVGENEEELKPRVALLAAESPFLQFNPGDFETEIIDEDERAPGADTFKISARWAPYEFDIPTTPSTDITKALDNKDWTLALKLAIQEGWRDENDMTNLIFFARHPELPKTSLDPKGPNFKKLSDEWTKILNNEVWKAIEASAENSDLVVSGKEVSDHHRRFFVGKRGKRLKKLVEDAAREADLNPGLLGTVMMAETRRPQSYLSSEKVSSYHIGADDFYAGRADIKSRVPAYAKVKWDKSQKPSEHLNDAKKPRLVKTIMIDSGPDAVLATAVYLKFREVRLREIAAESGEDFDSLPLATRIALTRIAMAAGTGGATPYLKDALKGKDIFVRQAIRVRAYQTKRNATVRTAQAMHLSDWVFGIPVPAAAASQPELEEWEGWNEEQSGYYHVYSDHEGGSGGDSESPGFEDSYVVWDRNNYEGNFDLERLDISEFQVEPMEEELVEEESLEEESYALRVREEPAMLQDEQPAVIQYDLPQSSAQVVVVGQRVELDINNFEFAKESEDIKWTIPGVVVRGYDGTAKDAKLFKLTDVDRQQPKISFFWVDAADGRIVLAKFRTKLGGLGQVAFAFDVKGPTVSDFKARTDVTRLEKSRGLLGMRFGKLIESPGIKWHWKISLPPTHEGYIKDVQTVLNDRTKILLLRPGGRDTRKLVWRHPSKTHAHVQVDGDPDGPEYTKGLFKEKRAAGSSFTNNGTSDSPHTELPPLAKTVSVNDQFTYYVMFKPAMKDSIWVPVAKARWFWKVTATRRDKNWVLNQPKPKMEATITLSTTEFPIYETNAFENEWREVSP